jgi:Xaa-Pro aminopeptidase
VVFASSIYIQRRERLRQQIQSGLILLMGNQDVSMNYAGNPYPFRQDSSFLYFFGLDKPGLTALIDVDEGIETVFGDNPTIDEIVWMGPQPSLKEQCSRVGISSTGSSTELDSAIQKARRQDKFIHFLPQYRSENAVKIVRLLDIEPSRIQDFVSEPLIRAVVTQRSIKSPEEIKQTELALEITRKMQISAMQHAKPGICEREIAGLMEGIAVSKGVRLAFPTINLR